MNATTPADLLAKLAEPFPPSAITWKPGATTKDGNKCMAMAYADLRAYQERLDAVCGLDWSLEYQPWGDTRIIARLTIGGVTRASTGEMDAQDQKNGMGGTVAEAQAAKRAAAMFGLGRYLYELPSAWVEFDAQAKRISKAGEAELNRRYLEWYSRKVAQKPAARKPAEPSQGPSTQPAAAAQRSAPPDATANGLGAEVDLGMGGNGDNPFEDGPWWEAARAKLVNGVAKFADAALNDHRNGGGPASAKQYGYLAGLIDQIVEQATGAEDTHRRVLTVLCQAEVTDTNPPSARLAAKLLDKLATHKLVNGTKIENSAYDQAVADAVVAVYRAAESVGTPQLFETQPA